MRDKLQQIADVDEVKKAKIEREMNRIAERELDKRNFEEAERRQAMIKGA